MISEWKCSIFIGHLFFTRKFFNSETFHARQSEYRFAIKKISDKLRHVEMDRQFGKEENNEFFLIDKKVQGYLFE